MASVGTDMLRAAAKEAPSSGTLTVAAVPAGDASDATARLRPALAAASLIAAGDAGRLRQLAAALGITLAGRVICSATRPPGQHVPQLLAALQAGQDVLLVTGEDPARTGDADRSLIAAAAAAGIDVAVLPGPSAVTAALAVAGLPADRFTFEGVPSRRARERERRFAELAAERRTLVFISSPRRLARTLAELANAFGGDRAAVVCRALAAPHQDVLRGTLGELAGQRGGENTERATPRSHRSYGAGGTSPRNGGEGEVTLVVAGAPIADAAGVPGEPDPLAAAVGQVRARVLDGASTRDAVAAVAAQTGLRKRDLYNAASNSGPAEPTRSPAGPPLG
jgi:16S rRNA (cytidine1402-2'-O)-methyltransferase